MNFSEGENILKEEVCRENEKGGGTLSLHIYEEICTSYYLQ